jgi:hypothetical protein
MHARFPRSQLPLALALAASVAALLAVCAPSGPAPKPKVVCTMENPATGERVELYEELRFKVPHDYDEARHIAFWKAQQAEKGFTREVQQR